MSRALAQFDQFNAFSKRASRYVSELFQSECGGLQLTDAEVQRLETAIWEVLVMCEASDQGNLSIEDVTKVSLG